MQPGDGEADDDAGEADHRADREVELAGDDEQRRGGGDDPELGRRASGRSSSLAANRGALAPGSSAKMTIVATRPARRAGLRPAQQARQPAGLGEPLVLVAAAACRWSTAISVSAIASRPGSVIARPGEPAPPERLLSRAARCAQRMPCLASVRIALAFSGVSTKSGPV